MCLKNLRESWRWPVCADGSASTTKPPHLSRVVLTGRSRGSRESPPKRRHDRVRSSVRSNLILAHAGRPAVAHVANAGPLVLHSPPQPTNIIRYVRPRRHCVLYSTSKPPNSQKLATYLSPAERACPTPTLSLRSRPSMSSFKSSTKVLRASSYYLIPTRRAGSFVLD